MTIYCLGATFQAAKTNKEAILEVINDARASSLKISCTGEGGEVPPTQYMVRQIGDETYPGVWTILDGSALESNPEYFSLWIIALKVELLLMEGAAFLDGSGFPASGTYAPPLIM